MIDCTFQNKVLAGLLRVSEFQAVASQHLAPAMFEGVVENNISKMILDYSKRYGVCMGQYEYIAGLKDLKEKKIISSNLLFF